MKRILFVDDEPNVLEGLKRMLYALRHEWDMKFVSSGEEALRCLAETPFDVLVTDVRMPHMSGIELLGEVIRLHPQVIRMVLSGTADIELTMASVSLAHQYLMKPCDAQSLRVTVQRAFNLRVLLDSPSLRELISQFQSLPSIPTVYTELVQVLGSPTVSAEAVGRIIGRDMGMTAKVLQLVNSAFFGVSREITNPVEAVVYLGMETVRALVFTASAFSQFRLKGLSHFSIEDLQQHSLRVGTLARQIARSMHLSQANIDHAFVGGLLHDIGKLVLVSSFPQQYQEAVRRSRDGRGLSISEAERGIFGAGHEEIGAYLLWLWGLPDAVTEILAMHHRPSSEPGVSPAVVAVHFANALVNGETEQMMDIDSLRALRLESALPEWREIHEDLVLRGSVMKRILCVDDEPNILQAMERQFRKQFDIHTAVGPVLGLEAIRDKGPFAVVVSDLRMPVMDGIEFLTKVRAASPDTVRVMLTGQADLEAAMKAVNEGNIFQFLTKPCPAETLCRVFTSALEQYRLITSEKELLEQTLRGSVGVLSEILSLVNPPAFGRAQRIRRYVVHMSQKLGLSSQWQWELAAMLSQIGSVTVPPELLDKVYRMEPLTVDESQILLSQNRIGHDLLAKIPRLELVALMVARQDAVWTQWSDRSDPATVGAHLLKVARDFDEQVARGVDSDAVLAAMKRNTDYNPAFVTALNEVHVEESQREVRMVALAKLRPGMIMHADVRGKNGLLLYAKGQEVTESAIARLQSFGMSPGIVEPLSVVVSHGKAGREERVVALDPALIA